MSPGPAARRAPKTSPGAGKIMSRREKSCRSRKDPVRRRRAATLLIVARRGERSQVMDLFLGIAEELGHRSDAEIAALADAGVESVDNWRSGAVREFKARKLEAAIASLRREIAALRALAGAGGDDDDMCRIAIEPGASPADLQRDFQGRIGYDYAGHRFLYYEPQGALAWEKLIGAGYEQELWLSGVEAAARKWLDARRDASGTVKGPVAATLGAARRDEARGLDVVALGCGEAAKEIIFLRELLAAETEHGFRCAWVGFVPVDVSIPLLLTATRTARRALGLGASPRLTISPCCADFEDGPLGFARRLRSADAHGRGGVRLVTILGNVLGNVRDEESFARQKLAALARPGDLVWIEVGVRPDRLEDDPLFHMTRPDYRETPRETNRRLLLEGPYRRMAAALGRLADIDLRVWLREGDETSRVPGSVNFTHDLVIKEERRSCTILYSRRYRTRELSAWFERLGYDTLSVAHVADSRGVARVANLLLRRRSA
jgi:hypothetical protein